MKIKPIILANTLAIIAFVGYMLFMLWAGIHRASYEPFWNTWATGHGFVLDSYESNPVDAFSVKSIFGIFSFTITNWVYGYAAALLYNAMSKKT